MEKQNIEREEKIEAEKLAVFKHLPKDQKLIKITYSETPFITTTDGADILHQMLKPSKGNRILNKEYAKEELEHEQELKEVKNMNAEDILEFLYEISDTWKESDNPLEEIRKDLRSMIRTYKEDKFEKMYQFFRIDM